MKRDIIVRAFFAKKINSQEKPLGYFFDVKNKKTTSVESKKNGV